MLLGGVAPPEEHAHAKTIKVKVEAQRTCAHSIRMSLIMDDGGRGAIALGPGRALGVDFTYPCPGWPPALQAVSYAYPMRLKIPWVCDHSLDKSHKTPGAPCSLKCINLNSSRTS